MDSMISDEDYGLLKKTAMAADPQNKLLKKIVRSRKIVRVDFLPKKTVKLGSIVLLWHSFLKKAVRFRIVLPDEVDNGIRNISVFAPISVAVFGHQENDHIYVKIGGIKKELRIIKVTNK